MKINFLKNIGWKLGGLVLAFGLWFHLTTQNHFSHTLTVNVEYANLNPRLRILPESFTNTNIEIFANGKQLFQLTYLKPIRLIIDLSEYNTPGKYSIELQRRQLTIPVGMEDVRVAFVGAKSVDVTLDWKKSADANPRN